MTKESNKIEKSVFGKKGEKNYDVIFSGTHVPDGKYKISIKAKKKISGAHGFREVEKIFDYDIDYKYPIPSNKSYDIIPFFKIDYDFSSENYFVNYAYNIKCVFGDEEKIGGASVDIIEDEKSTTKFFEPGNIFETFYIPNLPESIDGEREIITTFNFKYHDYIDEIYKRQKELRLETRHNINNEKITSYKHLINDKDNLIKSNRDEWKELDTFSLEGLKESENTKEIIQINPEEVIIDTSSYQIIKTSTLPYIPKTKKIRMKYEGRYYNFFYEIDDGPFYRSRIFKRKIGNENTTIKRYDSVPISKNKTITNDYLLPIELLSIKDNLFLEKTMSYNKYTDTMSLSFDYKFVNNLGEDLKSHEIDYAYFELKDSFGNIYDSYDMRNKSKIDLYSIPIGLYSYKIVTHNDYCIWNDNVLLSGMMEIKPNADEIISSNYVLTSSYDLTKFSVNISWEIYGRDVTNITLYLYDITNENTSSLITKLESPKYDNATIDNLIANHKYRYYFSFNSNNCIMPSDKRVSITDFIASR